MSVIAKPYTFSPNTTASSSQVNSNFDTLYNDYNGGISAANLATDAVTTAKIADANVTTAKLADGSVTSAKLAEAFFRGRYQSNTTNSAPTGLTVQFGWGFIAGDASDGVQETVTFPAAFSGAPVVLVSYIGARLTASGNPSSPADLTASPGDANRYALAAATTTTNFEVTIGDVGGTSSSVNYGYSWIAIGAV